MGTVRERNVVFQHWPVLWPWAILFLLFPLLVVFVPTAGSSLGQGQCLITGRTLSKASPDIAVGQITQEVGWATEVQCKSMSSCVPTTPRVVVWCGLGIALLVPIDLQLITSQAFHTDFWSRNMSKVGVRKMSHLYFAKILLVSTITECALTAAVCVGSIRLKFLGLGYFFLKNFYKKSNIMVTEWTVAKIKIKFCQEIVLFSYCLKGGDQWGFPEQ